ncbi:hypothetical protein FB451DRAFT_1168726 [Mycena latifolia]|nr:hypothetical protein FB451DRAFT_1168726 [Mycena latifolia]
MAPFIAKSGSVCSWLTWGSWGRWSSKIWVLWGRHGLAGRLRLELVWGAPAFGVQKGRSNPILQTEPQILLYGIPFLSTSLSIKPWPGGDNPTTVNNRTLVELFRSHKAATPGAPNPPVADSCTVSGLQIATTWMHMRENPDLGMRFGHAPNSKRNRESGSDNPNTSSSLVQLSESKSYANVHCVPAARSQRGQTDVGRQRFGTTVVAHICVALVDLAQMLSPGDSQPQDNLSENLTATYEVDMWSKKQPKDRSEGILAEKEPGYDRQELSRPLNLSQEKAPFHLGEFVHKPSNWSVLVLGLQICNEGRRKPHSLSGRTLVADGIEVHSYKASRAEAAFQSTGGGFLQRSNVQQRLASITCFATWHDSVSLGKIAVPCGVEQITKSGFRVQFTWGSSVGPRKSGFRGDVTVWRGGFVWSLCGPGVLRRLEFKKGAILSCKRNHRFCQTAEVRAMLRLPAAHLRSVYLRLSLIMAADIDGCSRRPRVEEDDEVRPLIVNRNLGGSSISLRMFQPRVERTTKSDPLTTRPAYGSAEDHVGGGRPGVGRRRQASDVEFRWFASWTRIDASRLHGGMPFVQSTSPGDSQPQDRENLTLGRLSDLRRHVELRDGNTSGTPRHSHRCHW